VHKHPCPQTALGTSRAVFALPQTEIASGYAAAGLAFPALYHMMETRHVVSFLLLSSPIFLLRFSVTFHVSFLLSPYFLYSAFIYSRALFLLCISRPYLPTSVFLLTFSTLLPFPILLSLPFRQFYPLSIINFLIFPHFLCFVFIISFFTPIALYIFISFLLSMLSLTSLSPILFFSSICVFPYFSLQGFVLTYPATRCAYLTAPSPSCS
jgi:hypothetical protein